jgi:hypothetical protein
MLVQDEELVEGNSMLVQTNSAGNDTVQKRGAAPVEAAQKYDIPPQEVIISADKLEKI